MVRALRAPGPSADWAPPSTAGRMQMFINDNTDISQFWEWSGRGLRPIDQTNQA